MLLSESSGDLVKVQVLILQGWVGPELQALTSSQVMVVLL